MAGAKQIRDEIMKMTIAVNSDPAQKAIYNLSEKTRELNEKNRELRSELGEVGRTLGKGSDEYKKIKDEINANSSAITNNKKKLEEMRGALNINQMTMEQLKREATQLRLSLAQMIPGTEPAQLLHQQLTAVQNRMREVTTGARQTSMSFNTLAERFNHYQGIVFAVSAALVGFGVTIQSIIDGNNKLEDAMSGVEKTTGMSRKEVEKLNNELSTLDTRTKRLDLLKIAEVGGRLGIQKSEIKDFVSEVDKANVALGDAWEGGAEKITESLGKVTTLYNETKNLPIATSINQVGSAVNELGASGAASEQNITEFATRVGALPNALKPTIGEALALGAAFEESGIDAERSGTAYSNFVGVVAKSADKFAEVMRLPVEDVKKMINSNPTEFFLKFSEGLKGMDATELSKVLDHLKLNDQYIRSIIGSASEKANDFRNKINLSNQSLQEATSLQEEFNKVNNNAAAVWEKLQKKMASVFTSKAVAVFLDKLITGFSLFVGVSDEAEDKLSAFGHAVLNITRVLAFLVATVISINLATAVYNTVIATSTLRTIALNVAEKTMNATRIAGAGIITLYRAALWLLGACYALVAGNTTAAIFAMRGFSAALMANPVGAVLTVVTALAGAFYYLKQRQDEAKESAKQLYIEQNKYQEFEKTTRQEGKNAVLDYKNSVDKLIGTIKSEIATKELRQKAYEALIRLHPQFIKTVDEEYRANADLARVYGEVARQVEISARAKARASALQSLYDEDAKDRIEYIKGESDREKEQQERNAARKHNNKYKNRGLVDLGGGAIDTPEDNYKTLNFTEHNKGAVISNKIAERNKLIQKITNADKARIILLEKAIKTAKGDNKKIIEFELNSLLGITEDATPNPNYNTNVGEDKGASKKTGAKISKKAGGTGANTNNEMDAYKRKGEAATAMARQIQLDIENAKIEAMEEGFQKELATIELQEKRRNEEIEKKKISLTEINQLDKKIANAKGNDKIFFESLKQSWLDNNQELEAEKELQNDITQKKKLILKEKYATEELKKEEENFQAELALLRRTKNEKLVELESLAQQKAFLQDKLSAEELKKVDTVEKGKAEIEKYYQKEELKRQVERLQAKVSEYNAIMALNPLLALDQDQAKKIEEYKNKIAELLAEVSKLKGGGTEDKTNNNNSLASKGKVDILGLSMEDWQAMFKNTDDLQTNIGKIAAATKVAQEMMGTYFAFVEANEKKQLQTMQKNSDAKKLKLKKELDAGYINQTTYKKLVLEEEKAFEKRKADLELESAKRQKAMQIASIISNTAVAIMNVWATSGNPILAGILTGVVAAMGALQLATVMNQPLPQVSGYEEGYYPITREQDGKQFTVRQQRLRSGLVNRPTHFIAGENNKLEMVIDQPTWTSYSPQLQSAIHSANARAKGFESGYNTDGASNSNDMMMMLSSIMLKNNQLLDNLISYGVEAHIGKTAQNGKKIDEMRQEYLNLKKQNKH